MLQAASVMFEFDRWSTPSDERPVGPSAAVCVRCGDAPRFGESGYCIACHWSVLVEVEAGFRSLCEYLRRWALFGDWCVQRGQPIV